MLPGEVRIETLKLVRFGCNTLQTSEAIFVLLNS